MISVKDLLEKPVANLGMSESFVMLCAKMGFKKIADIVAVKPEELLHRDGFTFHWLNELIGYLQKNQALHILQGRFPTENTSG